MFGAGISYDAGNISTGFNRPGIQCVQHKERSREGGCVLFLSYLSGVASSAIHWPILRFADDDVLLER